MLKTGSESETTIERLTAEVAALRAEVRKLSEKK